jgi:hypothetical protein
MPHRARYRVLRFKKVASFLQKTKIATSRTQKHPSCAANCVSYFTSRSHGDVFTPKAR